MTRQEKRGVTEERRPNGRRESPKRERRIGTPCQKTSLSAIAPVVPFTIPLSLSFDVDVFVLGFDSPTPRYSCSFSSPRNVRGATSSPNSSRLFGLAAPLLSPPTLPLYSLEKNTLETSKPKNSLPPGMRRLRLRSPSDLRRRLPRRQKDLDLGRCLLGLPRRRNPQRRRGRPQRRRRVRDGLLR